MKKLRFLGLLVVVLALSLAFIACNSDAGSGGGTVTGGGGEETGSIFGGRGGGGGKVTQTTQWNETVLFENDDDFAIYISKNQDQVRAAFQPGDDYFYAVYFEGEAISSGTLVITKDSVNPDTLILEFTPDTDGDSEAEAFTATLINGVLAIDGGSIIGDDGEEYDIDPLDATWSNVTSLSQVNGTWKYSLSDTETMPGVSENIDMDVVVEITFTVNAKAGTLSAAQKRTITFSGADVAQLWSEIKSNEEYIGWTANDTNHSLTETQTGPSEKVTVSDFKDFLINKDGDKLMAPFDDEMAIFDKQ